MPTTSVQMYSLRDSADVDLERTVARARKIGYENIEPYGFVENVETYERALSASGVRAPSGHAPVIDSADPSAAFNAAKRLGMQIVIDPFVPEHRWRTADDAKRLADRVNELAVLAHAHDLTLGYHNHQWEFANTVDGRPVFELFVDRLAPEVVLEVDTFWVTVGGADAPALLRAHEDRVVAIHVKDGRVAPDILAGLSSEDPRHAADTLEFVFQNQTPAGEGDLDVKAILAAAPLAIRVVEFDTYRGDVFEGIAQSLSWLRRNDLDG